MLFIYIISNIKITFYTMKELTKKFSSWMIIWAWFLFMILLWAITYSALENVWTPNQSLAVEEWATLTSDSWNKILGNIESLNTKIEDIKNNSSGWVSGKSWFFTKSYKLIWDWNASTRNCKKIILPEQCISEKSADVASPCSIIMTQSYKDWDKNTGFGTNNWYWSTSPKFNFRIIPWWLDNNHHTWKRWLLAWLSTAWTTNNVGYFRTWTSNQVNVGTPNYNWHISHWYFSFLWWSEWTYCPEFSEWNPRNYNSDPNKNPREITIAVRNDFDWVFTLEYPNSKDDSYFESVN